jgi:hypothetical protein
MNWPKRLTPPPPAKNPQVVHAVNNLFRVIAVFFPLGHKTQNRGFLINSSKQAGQSENKEQKPPIRPHMKGVDRKSVYP